MKRNNENAADKSTVFDCIIIGAGPGGLQAGIYLGRTNRAVLLIDRGGGRTRHAKKIENFLGHPVISGHELIETGIAQATKFNVQIEHGTVTRVRKNDTFVITTSAEQTYYSKFVIVSTGVYDHFPSVENFYRYFGNGIHTCVDCDGYRTTNKKLVLLGNSMDSVKLAFGMKVMYTDDITLVLETYDPPEDVKHELRLEGINLIQGSPARIVGGETLEAIEMMDRTRIPCEVIMSDLGVKLNDEFLAGLSLKKDAGGVKYSTNHYYESSLSGLYIVGPMNSGHDQAIIAAGEGAIAALDIKSRLLEI